MRLLACALVATLATGMLMVVAQAPAQASDWTSNDIFCSGPYTTAKLTSRARAGGSQPNITHVSYPSGPPAPYIHLQVWYNQSTTFTYRSSQPHGAGWTSGTATAYSIDGLNSSYGCVYIG